MKIKFIANLIILGQVLSINAAEPTRNFGFLGKRMGLSEAKPNSAELLAKLDTFLEGVNNGSMVYNGNEYLVECPNIDFFIGKDRNKFHLSQTHASISRSCSTQKTTENGIVTSMKESFTPGSESITIQIIYLSATIETTTITLKRTL